MVTGVLDPGSLLFRNGLCSSCSFRSVRVLMTLTWNFRRHIHIFALFMTALNLGSPYKEFCVLHTLPMHFLRSNITTWQGRNIYCYTLPTGGCVFLVILRNQHNPFHRDKQIKYLINRSLKKKEKEMPRKRAMLAEIPRRLLLYRASKALKIDIKGRSRRISK